MAESSWTVATGSRSPRFPSSKFVPPTSGRQVVRRARLHDRLDRGHQARLTLVVASAGAGKSVLLADWLSARPERPSAWLNCDSADADPARFGAAIIESLRRSRADPELGEDARQLLHLDGQVTADVMGALADDLERSADRQLLVVDDFHLTGAAGAGVLALLLDYRPDSLLVVVATRVEPDLRLQRMRANHQLVEVRDHDLSFSLDEASLFLSALGVPLDDRQVATVHHRSEGWATGLQMAGLAIQYAPDRRDAADRIELHRHTVAGYFLEEVLARQPPELVEFMLATAVLDELSGPACVALCGPGSVALLDQVYRDHLFVTMVDEQTGTYRYHQLIKEVLHAELHSRHPDLLPGLHQRAAAHLAETGQGGLAARHLLAAGDPDAAFRLLTERVLSDFSTNPTPGSALDDVQPEVFAGAPEILVPLAAELLLHGAFEPGARAFKLAQQAIGQAANTAQPEVAVRFSLVSSFYSYLVGELSECLRHLEKIPRDGAPTVSLEAWLVADAVALYCHVFLGQVNEARRLAEGIASTEVAPPSARYVLSPGVTSLAALADGDLAEADTLARSALDAAQRLGFDRHYFAFTARRSMALLALERRHLATAAALTEETLATLTPGRPIFDYLAQLDRARIWAASGSVDESLASLPAARAALRSDRAAIFALADELEARLRVAAGDYSGALRSAKGLPADRRMVAEAIIHLHAGHAQPAVDALKDAPTRGATIRLDLELRLLRADIALAQSSPQATRLVNEALELVDRIGFVQTVLDTAPRLIAQLVSGSIRYAPTANLVALVGAGVDVHKLERSQSQPENLPDPLTDAEIRVLEKLPLGLSYADIAGDLHLSLNTVKTHLRHTYMKLGVSSRSGAVKRAVSLGFI